MPTPSGRISRTASNTMHGTPIWCSVSAVASPPMPPPAMTTGLSFMGGAGVREPDHDVPIGRTQDRYNGILSCFFQGFSTVLFLSMLSARQMRRRVLRGRITSSM